jgi:transposase
LKMSRAKDIILTTEQIKHYQKYIKERVDIQEDGCWLWNKALDEERYGKASLNNPKRTIRAHRLAYAAFNGGVLKALNDEGRQLVVRHQCNNPPCANPDHLLIGTHRDNTNDMVVSGRVRYGEKHPNAVATNEQVKGVIESKGHMTKRERAEMFGVSFATVDNIDAGRTWAKHPARDVGFQPPPKKARPERPKEQPLDAIIQTYERILEKCVLSAEANKYTKTKCLLWTGSERNGYGHINIGQYDYQTHQIAWMFKTGQTFIPGGMVVRHLCGVRNCSNHEHVDSGTNSDNTIDQINMGIHRTAKLNEADVKKVWRLYDGGMMLTDIANRFNVTPNTIGGIVHGRTWTHVQPDQPVVKRTLHHNCKFTVDDVREIRRVYAAGGITQKQLADRYNVTEKTIWEIIRYKKAYKPVSDISTTPSDPQSTSPSPSQPDPLPPTTVLEGTGIDPSSAQT